MTSDQILSRYLATIRRPGVSEEAVHRFLARYPALLPVYWPFDNLVFSKLPLGSQHIVDFAFARENTGGVTWHFIEIERPGDAIFTRRGDPATRVVHGMRQTADWTTWFRDNRDYVLRHFPFTARMSRLGLTEPECILIIGRRSAVADRNRRLYEQMARNAGLRLVTFDRLADHLASPALDDRTAPLRVARFVNGDVRAPEVIRQMTMDVRWHLAGSVDRPSSAKKRRRKTF